MLWFIDLFKEKRIVLDQIGSISSIQCGNIFIDTKCFRVTLNGNEICLFPKEYTALCLFAQHPDWVFSKREIYEAVYGEEAYVDIDNIIFCLIHSLRKKLEPDLKHPKYIKTIRGVGYKLIKNG